MTLLAKQIVTTVAVVMLTTAASFATASSEAKAADPLEPSASASASPQPTDPTATPAPTATQNATTTATPTPTATQNATTTATPTPTAKATQNATTTATLAPPTRVIVTSLSAGYALSWNPGDLTGVIGYTIDRRDSRGVVETIATLPPSATMYRDESAEVGQDYTYTVTPFSDPNVVGPRAIASESAAAPSSGAIANEVNATAQCPATTVSVSTASQLNSALLAAKAGTVITLAPGTYVGQFKLRNVDGGSPRIWICGPKTAVLTTGDLAVGSALMLNGADNVVVHGISFTRSQKGVQVIDGQRVTLRNVTVTDVGYEAIHYRTQTVDSNIIGSVIDGTGLLEKKYGEGIYIGASNANWCSQNNCQPDLTARINVVDNTISSTGSQPIEAKEGTSSGNISGNRVSGSVGSDDSSKGLILVKGNKWSSVNNNVEVVSGYGLAVIFTKEGNWGNANVFTGNAVTGTPQMGIWVHKPTWPTTAPTVYCSNTVPAGTTLSNVPCVR